MRVNPMAVYETSFCVTPKQGRDSYIALLLRRDGVYLVSSFLVIALCISGLSNQYYKPLAGFGLGVVCVYWYSWLYGLHRARVIFSKLSGSELSVSLGEDYITFATPDGTSTLRWSAFSQLHRMKRFWILVRRYGDNYSLIPSEALDPEASAFLKLKMKEARVKIQ